MLRRLRSERLTPSQAPPEDAIRPTVEVYGWNPRRRVIGGRIGRRIPWTRPVNNFGDLLGPVIVDAMLDRLGLGEAEAVRDVQLASVGSVMHMISPTAVVWGTGVNGKRDPAEHHVEQLDVRAVRGPRTKAFLEERGVDVPDVFGDPALLLPILFPELTGIAKSRSVTEIPNLNDLPHGSLPARVVSPKTELWECLRTIAASELVVGSSLHGIVVAEALGIPARLVRPQAEAAFKYDDYYASTGRPDYAPAETADEAIRMGGEAPIQWSPEPLMNAFPRDLWAA